MSDKDKFVDDIMKLAVEAMQVGRGNVETYTDMLKYQAEVSSIFYQFIEISKEYKSKKAVNDAASRCEKTSANS